MFNIGDSVISKSTNRKYTITKLPEENKTSYHADRDGQDYMFFPDEIEKVDDSFEERLNLNIKIDDIKSQIETHKCLLNRAVENKNYNQVMEESEKIAKLSYLLIIG